MGHKPMFNLNFINDEGEHVVTVVSTRDNEWDAHLEGLALLDNETVSASDFNVTVPTVDGSPPFP